MVPNRSVSLHFACAPRVSSVAITAKSFEAGIGCPPVYAGTMGPLEAKSVPPFLRAPATTPATPFSPNVRKAAGRACRRGENNRGGPPI